MVTSTSGDDPNDFEENYVKQLCNPYIENKHTKIIKHKKMTPTTCKLQEIHTNSWGRMTHPPYHEKSMLLFSLMSTLINYGSSYFKARTNSLIHSSSGCYVLKKLMEKNSDAYKLIEKENLLLLH